MNIGVRVSFSVLVSSGNMPRSGMAGSDGGFIPNFLRNLHIVLHGGCINLHSHQQSRRVPFSSNLLQQLLFLDFFFMAILSGTIFKSSTDVSGGKNPLTMQETQDAQVWYLPGLGRSPRVGNGNAFQCSCLKKNPMDRGVWQATVQRIAKIRHYWPTKHALYFKPSVIERKPLYKDVK